MKNILALVLSVAINGAALGSLQWNVNEPTPRGEVVISQVLVADAAPVYASTLAEAHGATTHAKSL